MSVKTRQTQKNAFYYVTFTCFKWLPLFETTKIYDNVYKWFQYLETLDIKICGYVIMPNHIHILIFLPTSAPDLMTVIGNGKRFIAYEIVKRLQKKTDILQILEEGVKNPEKKKGKLHQVFEPSYDAKECFSPEFIEQKLNYIHKNPVSGKWKLAETSIDYVHSSARFYEFGEHSNEFAITHFSTLQ
jgi:REP element-mobilizing transposase RayT